MQILLKMQKLYQIQGKLLCRLLNNLYRPKQLEKLWNQNIIAFYKDIGFK